jgi:transposase
MLDCKASKKNALRLKRQQDKESKAKQTKRRAMELEDSSSSEDSMSVHNLEKPIPRKLSNKTHVAKGGTKGKPTNKTNGKKNNEDVDIGFLSAVKKMQIDNKNDMLRLILRAS